MRFLQLAVRLILLCALWTTAAAQPSQQLIVSGALRQTLILDASALAAFPAKDIGRFTQTRSGQGTDSQSTVRGVKLAALIERAGLAASGSNDWKTLIVIATATDGYRAVFSWPEITNTAVGDGVLVLFERDGKALDDREGRIALVSTADQRLGPRHVHNLVRIEIRSLE